MTAFWKYARPSGQGVWSRNGNDAGALFFDTAELQPCGFRRFIPVGLVNSTISGRSKPIFSSIISSKAMSATRRFAVLAINGKLILPPLAFSCRTRLETRFTRTCGLRTFANACLTSSAFIYRWRGIDGLKEMTCSTAWTPPSLRWTDRPSGWTCRRSGNCMRTDRFAIEKLSRSLRPFRRDHRYKSELAGAVTDTINRHIEDRDVAVGGK